MELLNYYKLRPCGPILLFKLNENSTLNEIKNSCCDLWVLNKSLYSLYDDSFCNLECISSAKLNDIFLNYEPSDKTLKPGEVCFYLMENLKNQNGFLNSQMACIESKSSSKTQDLGKSLQNGVEDIRKCIENLKQKKILKGIDVFYF